MPAESSGKISGTPTFLRTPSVSRNCKREGRAISVIKQVGISSQGLRRNFLVGGHLEFLGAPGPGVRNLGEKELCIASQKTKTILQIGGSRRCHGPSLHICHSTMLIWGLCQGICLPDGGYGCGFVMFCVTAREYAMVIGRAFGSVDEPPLRRSLPSCRQVG